VVCQKVVHPSRCLDQQCPFLYAYDAFGRTYVGCTQEIFAADIDLEVLERARRRRNGFGSVRAVREPLPICPADVERAYENREDPMGCINPEFHELPDRPSFRVIRRRLTCMTGARHRSSRCVNKRGLTPVIHAREAWYRPAPWLTQTIWCTTATPPGRS
jgi:hypothetical protein